jgi:GDPmannose 4,6-dehydratase
MLQQDAPSDYVIATGEAHSVREFLQLACQAAQINDWQSIVKHNPQFDRPAEVDYLIGDVTKAKQELNWEPSVNFQGLVELMVQAELKKEAA